MKYFTALFFICAIAFVLSCEKDDICAETTPTTPHLIIRFYDVADADQTKTVTGLFAQVLNDDLSTTDIRNESVLNRDSIALPLRTDQDITRFLLYTEYEFDDGGTPDDPDDDDISGNPDTIEVIYTREDVYVSRACGFKTIFKDLQFSIEVDADNWIITSSVETDSIINENAAHVQIFH